MEWSEAGIVLSARRHGETSLVVSVFARGHGRHKGLARGAATGRQRGIYEPGTLVEAAWQARLTEHLGVWRLESLDATAAGFLDDPPRLACLEAAMALADAALPERLPYPAIYDAAIELLAALGANQGWAVAHLRWEMTLLTGLGYGLDLENCAVSGAVDDLAWVSPRSGRAVSRSAGAAYSDRLLVLPRLFGGLGRLDDWTPVADLTDALKLTGYFLERHVLHAPDAVLPESRDRYVDRMARFVASSAEI